MKAVSDWGGWSSVFPLEISVDIKTPTLKSKTPIDVSSTKFPEEQSRVRNFFNITPKYLT